MTELTPDEKRERRDHPERFSKLCKRCGETKPLTEFYLNSAHPDSRQYRCKDCDNDARAARSKVSESGRTPRSGKACHVCEGMPWRRPLRGFCRCGGVHRAEDMSAARAAEIERRRFDRAG